MVNRIGSLVLVACLVTIGASTAAAGLTDYFVNTVVGTGGSPGFNSLEATTVGIQPGGIVVDAKGVMYVSDTYLGVVYRLRPTNASLVANVTGDQVLRSGRLEIYAGNGSLTGAGHRLAVQLDFPSGLAMDAGGNLFIAETGKKRIRKVAPDGQVTTVAGAGGACGSAGDGGLATAATLCAPMSLAVDLLGNLYIGDTGSARVRKVDAAGVITTYAGSGGCAQQAVAGPRTQVGICAPISLAWDDVAGNLYIGTSAGVGIVFVTGDSAITISDAGGDLTIDGLAISPRRHLIASYNGIIAARAITAATLQGVIGGTYSDKSYGGDGGKASAAKFIGGHLAVDNMGNIYVAETARVRMLFEANGLADYVTTQIQATPAAGGMVWRGGYIYVSDWGAHRVLRVQPGTPPVVTTVVGAGTAGFSGDNGAPTAAQLNFPQSIAFDGSGRLYISDSLNHRVRRVDFGTNRITTVAGNGSQGSNSGIGPATSLPVDLPGGLAVDTFNNFLFIGDGYTIQRVNLATNQMELYAGAGVSGYSGDNVWGGAINAKFGLLRTLAADSVGDLYVGDGFRIRRINRESKSVFTMANLPGDVRHLTTDFYNNLYATTGIGIHRITPGGAVHLLAGGGSGAASPPFAPLIGATLNSCFVAATPDGELYFCHHPPGRDPPHPAGAIRGLLRLGAAVPEHGGLAV